MLAAGAIFATPPPHRYRKPHFRAGDGLAGAGALNYCMNVLSGRPQPGVAAKHAAPGNGADGAPKQCVNGRRGFVSDIFSEVDEEVRREQLKKLWERYGNYVIAAAFVVVLAVAAWRGYDWWETRKAAEAGAAYDAAARLADEGKHEDAEAAFAKVAT